MADEEVRSVDITRCSLCKETSLVPKRLPCFHIFCINCLETASSSTRTHLKNKASCPVCRTDFSLPSAGFASLHTDSFVQRITKVSEILNLSSGNLLCDACEGDSDTDSAEVTLLAQVYCPICCIRLCGDCRRVHEKSGLTRNHTLVNLKNQAISKELMEQLVPSICVIHTEERLKLYCFNCKSVVCVLCYLESHQTHRWSEIELVANEFRTKIQNNVCFLSRFGQDILNKIQLIQIEKSDTFQRTGEIMISIDTAKHGLKRVVDAHADILIQEIQSLNDTKIAEIEADCEDLTRELSTLQCHLSYAKELDRKGYLSDFCQVVDNFDEILVELEYFKKCRQSRQAAQFCIDFKKSNLEDFLTKCDGNCVGKVYVENDVKRQSQNGQNCLEDILSKSEKLQKELNESKITIKGLNLDIEQLKQSLYRANFVTCSQQRQELESQKSKGASVQAVVDGQKLQLEKEMDIFMSLRSTVEERKKPKKKKTKKKKTPCEEKPMGDLHDKNNFGEVTKTTLQTMIDELKEKFYKETQSNTNLQKIIEKQKQEFDVERGIQISVHTRLEKSNKELEECRLQIEEIQKIHVEHTKEWTVSLEKERKKSEEMAERLQKTVAEKDQQIKLTEDMVKTLNEKVKHFEQLLELSGKGNSTTMTAQGSLERSKNPVLNHTIARTSTGSNSVLGLTVLGNDLFLISGSNSDIEIYDSATFSFKNKVAVKGLTNPQDIVSCPKYECLYIMDLQRIKYVMRLEITGKWIRKWSTGNDGGRLSVTKNSTLIVTYYHTNQLREYSRDGEMLHEVKFSQDSGIVHPWHAVELSNGDFAVCFGCREDTENKLCIVNRDGSVLLQFGGNRGSKIGQLYCPVYLATDSTGNIIVADQNNSRLLLLSPQLTFIRKLVTLDSTGGTRRLSKFYLDESKKKLFVADNEWNWNVNPGNVLVFSLD